jgi:hypothetical protein
MMHRGRLSLVAASLMLMVLDPALAADSLWKAKQLTDRFVVFEIFMRTT